MTSVEVAVDVRDDLGESPRWHAATQTLYWIDVWGKVLHRYTPAENRLVDASLPKMASALAFRREGGLLLAAQDRVVQADESGQFGQTLASTQLLPDARFNDAAVDARGRFWVGAFCNVREQDNQLYSLSPGSNTLQAKDSGIRTANGIAWSPDNRILYFADSDPRVIYAYDFDVEQGIVSNRRVFVDSADQPGVPDGITVDAEGSVWCAFWNGWRVVRYSPAGVVLQVVDVPAARVTAPAFGGEKLNHLYITSAIDGDSVAETGDHATAGRLFVIETETPGLLPFETSL